MSSHPTSNSPSLYEALPLSYGEIRVLEVAPASFGEPVECTMKRISLLDDPVPCYETISYCWGPPRRQSTITLNGHLQLVTASSEAALRLMRLCDRPRALWIDATCIDQSSMTERSVQVALMTTVYSTAMHNLIYLGDDDEAMAYRAVKAVLGVVDDMRKATADSTLLYQTLRNGKSGSELFSNESFSESMDFEALEALYSLGWFSRLWVLQEAVLASSNTCYWGTCTFHLSDILQAARWLMYKWEYITHSLHCCVGLRCAGEMFDTLYPDDRFASKRKYLDILLGTTQQFEKSEPKDSIYAILGLLDEDTSLENSQAALLRVDYTKSLPDVLRDATRFALCQRGDLHVLGMISHHSDVMADSQQFPTWTFRVDLRHTAQTYRALPAFFNACEGLELASSLNNVSFGGNVMLLQGIVVEEVLQTSVTCPKSTWQGYEDYHEWLVSVKEIAMSHCHVAHREELYLALAFTLTAANTFHGNRAQAGVLQPLVGYLESLIVHEGDVASNTVRTGKGFDWEKMRFITESVRTGCCVSRRFFVTAAGRPGIGPRCMQPGDIVAVLRGGKTPFVLRKKADGYWLLGETYVHGIMDGEAVQIHKAQGGSEEMFHVR